MSLDPLKYFFIAVKFKHKMKYAKATGTVCITIQRVTFNISIKDMFYITWGNGNKTPKYSNANGSIIFDFNIELERHFFVAKGKKSVRKRFVNLILKRGDQEKICGRLQLNISNYLLKKKTKYLELEMESGFKCPPIIFFSIRVENVSIPSVFAKYDDDPEFDDKVDFVENATVDTWEIEETEVTIPIKKVLSRSQIPVDCTESTWTLITIPQKRDNLKSRERRIPRLNSTQEFYENLAKRRERLKNCDIVFAMLLIKFPPYVKPPFYDRKQLYQFPPALFPLFAALIYSRILIPDGSVTYEDFEYFVDDFTSRLIDSPLSQNCSLEDRFLTVFLLNKMVDAKCSVMNFLADRVSYFRYKMYELVLKSFRSLCESLFRCCGVLCNRIATAQFDQDAILADLKKVKDDMHHILSMPSELIEVIVNQVLAILDAKIVDKILSNTNRLTFDNATSWNSFATAVEMSIGKSFVLLREFASIILLFPQLVNDVPLEKEILKHMPHQIVFYVMNILKKKGFPNVMIDVQLYGDRYGLYGEVEPDPIKPIENISFNKVDNILYFEEWNRCILDQSFFKSENLHFIEGFTYRSRKNSV